MNIGDDVIVSRLREHPMLLKHDSGYVSEKAVDAANRERVDVVCGDAGQGSAASAAVARPVIASGGSVAAIIPQSFEDAYRLAKVIASSGLAPHGMDSPEKVMVAIMAGLEIGLPPMIAVQKIAVIKGRPTIWGDAVPALLWSKGFKISERIDGAGDGMVAVCTVLRPDGNQIEREFSVRDALRAGLWDTRAKIKKRGKNGEFYEAENDSPWYRFPARMLQMRARGYACRDGAADVLAGLYIAEEIDEPMRHVTPVRPADVISSEQEEELRTAITASGADITKFLALYRIDSLSDLPAAKFDAAVQTIAARKSKGADRCMPKEDA